MSATLKRIGIILLLSGVVAVVANMVHPRHIPWAQSWSNHVEARARKAGIKVIPLSVALEIQAQFIDVRSREKFDRGHIPDALSIPLGNWEDSFLALASHVEAKAPMVFYCSNRACDDALLLALEVQQFGGTNIVLYVDGFELWEQHGGPVEGRASSRPNGAPDRTTQRSSLQEGAAQ